MHSRNCICHVNFIFPHLHVTSLLSIDSLNPKDKNDGVILEFRYSTQYLLDMKRSYWKIFFYMYYSTDYRLQEITATKE